MSLLLDALKKAANEKHKNTQTIHDSGSSSKQSHVQDKSLELELNSEIRQNISKKDKSENVSYEEFPLVSEPEKKPVAITQTRCQSNKTADISVDIENSPEVENLIAVSFTDRLPEQQPEQLELKKTELEKTKIKRNNITEIDHKKTDVIPASGNTLAQVSEPREEHNTKYDTAKIENEQVLSELINKSNQYGRKKKIKRNISIAILVLLIITGSILYFYIEMQAAKQGIYIADDKIDYNYKNTEPSILMVNKNNNKIDKKSLELSELGYFETDKYKKNILHEEKNKQPENRKFENTTAVNFTRSKKNDPVHGKLLQAYSEFYKKNYKKSEKIYKNVLNIEKKNRNALLGLAAIAIKQKRYEYARQKYNYILSLHPRDSIATAGLIGIDKQSNSQISESRLKFMLRDDPDAAPLHFALGNIYSEDKKWPEAQKLYFKAWSVDDKNADYAFNLAISLDHLNKKKQALKFYMASLKLKHKNGGNFSATGVKNRIISLKKSLQ